MKKRLLFYSSCKTLDLFKIQQFYVIDINIFQQLGFTVTPTNRIRDFLKFWQYDYGFYYFYKKSFFPALIAKIFFKKNYFTGGIDEFSSTNKKIFFRQKLFFFLSYMVADKCILVSNADAENIKNIYHNRLRKKITFAFHGIDIQKLICSENDFAQKDNNFISVAWQGSKVNVIRKGLDKAIKVFSELKQFSEFQDSFFYILGKCGEGTSYLKEICKRYDVEASVIFIDELAESEKIELLKKSRFYFQLSTYEGFGLAALEALAAKDIVIHSGNGGLKDVVEKDGIILYDNYTAQDLREIINSYDIKTLFIAEKRIFEHFTIEKRKSDFETIILKG